MVDAVKNYGIAGVSSTIELGKQGAVIDATNSSLISLKDKDGSLEEIRIANGTASSHAVTKAQLDSEGSQKLQYHEQTVNYNSGTVSLGSFAANTTIQSIVVEKGAGNWTSYNNVTEITIGDSGDTDRLFSGFTPDTSQYRVNNNHTYSSTTTVNAYVTQGAAEAGTADIRIWYSGTRS